MAADITEKLGDKLPLVLCVLTGGIIPSGHILTHLKFPLELDYIHATRYAGETQGGELQWLVRPKTSLKNRHILIIDDILDVGTTLAAIIDDCKAQGAEEVYSAVLVDKMHDRKHGNKADFVGLQVEDKYVFGFGMDYKDYWRNLPAIYAVKDS
jgi:hypoxanthine phosphoribosyltransferase